MNRIMDEREKRDRGLLYDASPLLEESLRCKDLCFEFNGLRPSQLEEKRKIIRRLFGRTGRSFLIQPPFWCDYGYNIEIGENFYANHNCVILDCNKVVFGDNVLVGPNCGFYTAGHPLDAGERLKGLEYARPIKVGCNVWIGAGVSVMPGVTIGDNTVIAAGAVVTKDIPEGSLAAGVPARVIKRIDV